MPSTRGRIVVGVDGTTASAAAVRWAAREGRLRRASVHLLYVQDSDQSGHAPYARAGRVPASRRQRRWDGAACGRGAASRNLAAGLPVI
jgi:nucleotide-binding universal stress UspA family protein